MKTHWSPVWPSWRAQACASPGSIVLESSLPSEAEHHSLLFTEPQQILTANAPDDLPALFAAIESALTQGKWAAGYVAYEAGAHFQGGPALPSDGPLAHFGIFEEPRIFDHHVRPASAAETAPGTLRIAPMPQITAARYTETVRQVQEWIAAGETYQLNYTMQLQSPCPHPPLEVYNALSAQQPSSYAAIVHFPNLPAILSFSPELFFRVTRDGLITTKPMKGTTHRGVTPEEDRLLAQALQQDEKNRAEHVMIVDLLRNDLNRICRTGTVRTDDLFHIEQYETLHQMTSRVSGALQQELTWYQVFCALFPGGSITGAPKRHTSHLIAQVEPTPRGVYTGAIGYFAPDRTAAFNIAIRTAVLQVDTHSPGSDPWQGDALPSVHPCLDTSAPTHAVPPDGEEAAGDTQASRLNQEPAYILTLGVGGGIVADSTAASEYNEALLKSAFVLRASHPYGLIETMRAEHGRIPFLEAHLQRLTTSAVALGFKCNTEHLRSDLARSKPHGRVRLLLHRDGRTEITVTEAPSWPAELHLALSSTHTNAASPHLRHKTTFRPEYSVPTQAGLHDTLFQNTRGELTESCIATLLVSMDGQWYTPPLTSGLLPGVMRAHLLATGQVQERILTLADLRQSTAAALCNALRGSAPIASLRLPSGERIQWKPPSSLPHARPLTQDLTEQ